MNRDRDKDMLVLEWMFFENLQRNGCEYGGIGIDSKRPFGNSDVEGDILEGLGATMEGDDGEDRCWSSTQRAYAKGLYNGLLEHLRRKYSRKP